MQRIASLAFRLRIGTLTMTTFDKREEAFERKFALDEQQKFKAEVRRAMSGRHVVA